VPRRSFVSLRGGSRSIGERCAVLYDADRSYRTTAALSYPPHIIALTALYTTALLQLGPLPEEEDEMSKQASDILDNFRKSSDWERTFGASSAVIEGKVLFSHH
jgi:hypothetical protein